ncbi:DNA double-strand break repair and VJ recombination XRCC4 [Beauveria brongniartii RCEF 3172]|uniref:DNA double-strand break repair and VJ recombination XRCC4 n=1 Tax=Beauveria brongniartii RCEF 3172 TaxID=1081107 RepID=A0A162M8A7_9HYPO|nr:DNA double-strand break repair and VJ recombination XRCC4 [Beauveria brongniartii RCEF 3172]
MVTSRVLKVPQSDNDKEFVLLQASSSGKKPLDLKLIGTEGEAPYVVKTRHTVKHDRVPALKVKNSHLSDSEWESLLEDFFYQKPLKDINATATVQSEAAITITIRKQVQGITQRLGAITLSHDANEAIELFEWCAASADAVVASNEATAQIQSKATELEASIHQLKEQLEELLKAKDEDETALLQKFRDLLNEKKVKIREQQKVLASGSFSAPKQEEPREPSPEPEPEAPRTKARGRKPAATRARKRKAVAPAKEESDEEDVAGELSPIKLEPEDTDDGQTTEATASVDGDSDEDEEMADNGEDGEAAAPPPRRESSPPKKTAVPPPKRALPFANRKPKDAPKPVAQAGGADTDSDGEL